MLECKVPGDHGKGGLSDREFGGGVKTPPCFHGMGTRVIPQKRIPTPISETQWVCQFLRSRAKKEVFDKNSDPFKARTV